MKSRLRERKSEKEREKKKMVRKKKEYVERTRMNERKRERKREKIVSFILFFDLWIESLYLNTFLCVIFSIKLYTFLLYIIGIFEWFLSLKIIRRLRKEYQRSFQYVVMYNNNPLYRNETQFVKLCKLYYYNAFDM